MRNFNSFVRVRQLASTTDRCIRYFSVYCGSPSHTTIERENLERAASTLFLSHIIFATIPFSSPIFVCFYYEMTLEDIKLESGVHCGSGDVANFFLRVIHLQDIIALSRKEWNMSFQLPICETRFVITETCTRIDNAWRDDTK